MKEEEHKDQDDRSSKVYCAGLTPLGDGDRCMRAEGKIWVTFCTLPKESTQTCTICIEYMLP